MDGKWFGWIQPMCSAPGHSWQGFCFFVKSGTLFIKSVFWCVFMLKPPFFDYSRHDCLFDCFCCTPSLLHQLINPCGLDLEWNRNSDHSVADPWKIHLFVAGFPCVWSVCAFPGWGHAGIIMCCWLLAACCSYAGRKSTDFTMLSWETRISEWVS